MHPQKKTKAVLCVSLFHGEMSSFDANITGDITFLSLPYFKYIAESATENNESNDEPDLSPEGYG